MADPKQIEVLHEAIDKVLEYDRENRRESAEEWGSFNFRDAEHNLTRIFSIVGHLKTLPHRLFLTSRV